MEIYYILQGLIHTFNNDAVRNAILRRTCLSSRRGANRPSSHKTKHTVDWQWKGTFRLGPKTPFVQYKRWRRRSPDTTFLFTAYYVYRRNRVHYVAFAFQPSQRRLVCFDPGYDLYLYGRHKIIPMVANAMHASGTIDTPLILKGPCLDRQGLGIQFNGENPKKTVLPADAFCQMWTLFFLRTYVQSRGDLGFFNDWCKITPPRRPPFLLSQFTIPMLHEFDVLRRSLSSDDLFHLQKYLTQTYWRSSK